jgi:5-methylcytosine-specific restriction endonuclease McrA
VAARAPRRRKTRLVPEARRDAAGRFVCLGCKRPITDSARRKWCSPGCRQQGRYGVELTEDIRRLRALPYREYLKTKHWQRVRTGAVRRAKSRCQLCNEPGQLHVHHRTYERLGAERNSDLIALCEDCHAKFHAKLPKH